MLPKVIRLLSCLTLLLISTGSHALSDGALWAMLSKGEAVALMRHAIAPGNGDPANFVVDDCRTQRNLSDEGVQQAVRIGKTMREHNISLADVYTSQWCRCIDTASAFELGKPVELSLLNSFYQDRSTEQNHCSYGCVPGLW